MPDAGQGVGQRLDATLDECVTAAQVYVGTGDAGSPQIILPVAEWSRLVQDAARAVGYLTYDGG